MLYHKYQLSEIKICSAGLNHAKSILNLITPHFETGVILSRDEEDIKNNINNFIIAEKDSKVIACTAVRDFGNGLFEIRSLAVEPGHSGIGIGSALISYAVDWVQSSRNGERVFALTLRPNVFKTVGFKLVVKEMFPEKVWYDCEKCKKKEHCDEIALLYDFSEHFED